VWLSLAVGAMPCARAQEQPSQTGSTVPAYKLRAQRFLAGGPARGSFRRGSPGRSAGAASSDAQQNRVSPRAAVEDFARPQATGLGAAWTAVGPAQVASQSFGKVTGRVTAVAIDPSDATGNTVYLGTTGGGVWKSTNAAGPAANVSFLAAHRCPPVFSANSGMAVILR